MDFLAQADWWRAFFRWARVSAGIMWIGPLLYFNFTQTPTVPKIPAEMRPAVVRYILPEALFWFRWGAMFTLIFGLILAWLNGYLFQAIGLGIGGYGPRVTSIGWGMWLGAIMWVKVWFLLWPDQEKGITLTPGTPH